MHIGHFLWVHTCGVYRLTSPSFSFIADKFKRCGDGLIVCPPPPRSTHTEYGIVWGSVSAFWSRRSTAQPRQGGTHFNTSLNDIYHRTATVSVRDYSMYIVVWSSAWMRVCGLGWHFVELVVSHEVLVATLANWNTPRITMLTHTSLLALYCCSRR